MWTLRSRSGARAATCDVRRHPLGLELMVEIDGDPYFTQVHRDVASLDDEAEALKSRLLSRGWA